MRQSFIDEEVGNGYPGLANAIVIQAAKDYQNALKILSEHPHNYEQIQVKREVRKFFRSDWFSVLCPLDGNWMLNEIEEEFYSGRQKGRIYRGL